MNPEALELWLERGVKVNPKTGKFYFVRDYRLSLNTPPQMGFDQLESLWDHIVKSDIDVFCLLGSERVNVKGVTDSKKKSYLGYYKDFIQYVFVTTDFSLTFEHNSSLENHNESLRSSFLSRNTFLVADLSISI